MVEHWVVVWVVHWGDWKVEQSVVRLVAQWVDLRVVWWAVD
jgi:hypothetical protein